MSSIGGPPSSDPSRKSLGRQSSISSLEQGLNMVNLPPTIAPVTIYPGPGARHANMAKADLDLVQRLQQLRGSSSDIPSETEMAERLAKLKGLPPDYYTKPSNIGLTLNTDRRTDGAKTQDLLTQVLEEVNLESKLPNPDQELAGRLSELRGGAPAGPVQQVPSLDSPGLPEGLDDMDEVSKLLKEANASATAEAASALSALHADPILSSAIAQSVKEKKGNRKGGAPRSSRQRRSSSFSSSTDQDERLSPSSGEEVRRKVTKVKKMGRSSEKTAVTYMDSTAAEDENEVSRIVDMYAKRAADKKKRKMMKKKAAAPATKAKCEAKDSQTDSSSELSESDLENSTSEKLSDSSG